MLETKKDFYKYTRILLKRVYRPIKPGLNPLLGKIKIWQGLGVLVVIGGMGCFVNGWELKPQERASRWPWSSQSHSLMAMAWFEAGDETRALDELKTANELAFIKTRASKESLQTATSKVMKPARIREEITDWEKLLTTMPWHKDIFLKLALLEYQIYNNEKARDYFEKANYLDPNGEEVLEVKKIIF